MCSNNCAYCLSDRLPRRRVYAIIFSVMKKYLKLFAVMLKTGLFTFGGGYAMISLMQREFVEKSGWLEAEEFVDLVAIAESTPGPIAINCATFIGYKTGKILGAAVATLAMCIPSFVIIFLISLFFDAFLQNRYVAAAFEGVRICVLFLIVSAGIKMAAKVKKSPLNIIIFCITFAGMVLTGLFAVNFSSVFYILIGGAAGTVAYAAAFLRGRKNKKGFPEESGESGEEDKK